jgi:hypothetical protein
MGSYAFFIQLNKHTEQGSSIFHVLLLALSFTIYQYLEFAAPPIWLRCSFFIYPAFLKTPPSEKIELEPQEIFKHGHQLKKTPRNINKEKIRKNSSGHWCNDILL